MAEEIKKKGKTAKADEKLSNSEKENKPWQFKEGYDPRRNLKGREKGSRDWHTDFEEAIKSVAKQTGKKKSEIRTDLLIRGIAEARKGNFNFWKEIVERNYGKVSQPIEGEIDTPGAKELAKSLQDILDKDDNGTNKNGKKGNSKKNS